MRLFNYFQAFALAVAIYATPGIAIAQGPGQNCEAVHNSNLGVCRGELQSQCTAATNYANTYCGKAKPSVEDKSKCSRYSKTRDQKCAAMGSCRRQADAAFNTCKQQRAAAQSNKKR